MKQKFVLYLSLMFILSGLFSCNADDNKEVENQITFEALPSVAQKFITDYFGGKENVEKVVEDFESDLILYDVETKDGYEIVFNAAGYWQEIDAPDNKTIPTSILPEPIAQTLYNQYRGYGVVAVNTAGENYHIVLSNNQGGESIGMTLNQSGEILNYDTDPL